MPDDLTAAGTAATLPVPRPAARGGRGRDILRRSLQHVVWGWLLGLIVIFGLLNGFFLSTANLQNILTQATVLGLLGLAQSLPLLVSEIDLSIAANAGFSSVVGALLVTQLGAPSLLGAAVGIAAGAAIGFVNGVCITSLRMVSLIESLGMMIILQGALLAISQGNTITDLPDAYAWIGQATFGGWPVMPLVLLAAFVAMSLMLRRTVLGRSLYATGGNAAAAFVAGIRTNRIKVIAFTLSGLLAGIAGYLLAAWQLAITSDQGNGFLLYAIAAPIIGGVSVFGGRGNTLGIFGGVMLLTVIHVGLAVVSVPSFYVNMIGGVLIFVAVAVDAIRVNLVGEG